MVLSLLTLTILGGLQNSPVKAQTATNVSISNLAFDPATLFILPGSTITWTNNDNVIHKLWFTDPTDGSTIALSDPIPPHGTWSRAFSSPIRIRYYDFDRLWIIGDLVIFTYDADANGDGNINQADVDLISQLQGSSVSCSRSEITCHADVDDDFDIDSQDVSIVSAMALGVAMPTDPDADGDSDVDIDDLIDVFLNQFSATCPFPAVAKAHQDVDHDCDIDIDDLIDTFLSQFRPWPPQ